MKVIIIGAGGHARVIADALLCRNRLGESYDIIGFLDDNEGLWNREYLGVRVIGNISDLEKFEHDGVVVGIGENLVRQKLYLELKERGENIIKVIHPSAILAVDTVIGDGTVIFAGVIINSRAQVGSNVILNTACTVGHDLVVCSHAQIGPGVNLGGGVIVGEGAFVAIGSVVIPYKTIGSWAVVGSGAAVINDVLPSETVVGVPAKPLIKKAVMDIPDKQDLEKTNIQGIGEIIQSDDVKKWQSIIETSFQFDFYHTLEYHLIAEELGEGKPILFVYQDGHYRLALPFLLRPIFREEWFPHDHKEVFDVTSVYGYSGPISSHKYLPVEFIKQFSLSLISALRELHVVSLFSRLHPLIDFGASFDNYFRRKMIGETVSIDLSIPAEDQVSQYNDSHKRRLRKLAKDGFTCFEDVNLRYLDDFIKIYIETMDRVCATSDYYFPREYFISLIEKLHGMMHLFVCTQNNNVTCASLISHCGNIIQYHLGGTLNNYKKHSPMILLLDTVREWGINKNAAGLHLGGGVGSAKDSLFNFKAGFSHQRHSFNVIEKILLPEEYKTLCAAKAGYNKANNLQNRSGSFFPLYRSPVEKIPVVI